MKIFQSIGIIGIVVFFSFSNIKAQNQPIAEIEKSTQKVIINKKTYYLHTVKKGQTLYSIARAYNCTVNEVLVENPGLTDDIKVDQVIKVPLKDNINETAEKNNEVTHVVMQGQTLFSIARMYGISVDEIKLANHLTSDTLRVAQPLIIPVNKRTSNQATTDTSLAKQYIIHRVQEKETLFSLAKKYGTTIEKIVEANPGKCDTLKIGVELKIPAVALATVIQPNCDSIKFEIKGKSITLSLLLPFFANNKEAVRDDNEDQENNSLPKNTEESFSPLVMNFLEFYQGVLLAIEELKKEGLNVELNVFDTGKSADEIKAIVAQPAFQKSQLIFGPVFSTQVPVVAEYARQKRIPMVLPVGVADSISKLTPGLFQVSSGLEGVMEQLIQALTPDSVRNILVVYNGRENQLLNQQFHNLLIPLMSNPSKKVKEYYIYNFDFKEILNQLDTVNNHIVSCSTDEVFVASLLGKLETKLLYYPVHTYGMSEWQTFNSLDLNYFYNQQFTCFSNFYVNYENESVLQFLKKYRLRFATEPVRNSKYGFSYSMLGYDITQYFLRAAVNAGNNFSLYNCVPYPPLNVKMKFLPFTPSSGFVNKAFYRIQYQKNFNFTVE